MCRFVPGQAIAIGPMKCLNELGEGLPGDIEVRPLVTEGGELNANLEIAGLGTAILRTDPGLELLALSRLSARLATAIESNEAIVDLNHIIPLSAEVATMELATRLSPYAEKEAAAIRRMLRSALHPSPGPMRVAVLDSGLSPEYVPQRKLKYFDYSAGGRLTLDRPQSDPLGHGTRVVKVLDQILPSEVELVVGRLPSDADAMTALTVAQAFGDIVAREVPEVVNLSVAPRNDAFVCPACRQRMPVPTFLSSFLPLVVRLGGRSHVGTVTVMASGNTGQVPNSRWLTDDVDTLIFAVAENRRGERTRYSSAPEGPRADLFSAGAFGGDDPEDGESQGVFLDGSRGTSFAAPFVSAVALLTKRFHNPPTHGIPNRLGLFTRDVIASAREGRYLQMHSPEEAE